MYTPSLAMKHVVAFLTTIMLVTVVASTSIGQTTHSLVGSPETSLDLAEAFDAADASIEIAAEATDEQCDRLWVISTRGLTSNACRVNLENPALAVSRLSCSGRCENSSLDDYLQAIHRDRPVVIYVHGNRLEADEAICRAIEIYRATAIRRCAGPVDWVLWSWPSAQEGLLIRDFRMKAERTDAQGLYLAWLLRKQNAASMSTSMIGYSFGAPVVTGSLHALAGGSLGGRRLPGPGITGAKIGVGLVAPAMASDWLVPRGYHGNATQNLDQLVLLYNRRDAILKRYWLLDHVRGDLALGYTGPKAFGPRADGSKLPVRSRDCAAFIGLQHKEVDYYTSQCRAGSEMALLIHDSQLTP